MWNSIIMLSHHSTIMCGALILILIPILVLVLVLVLISILI